MLESGWGIINKREAKPVTLVGSEKRQIRQCFMLISMEISLIYQMARRPARRVGRRLSVVAPPGPRLLRRRLYQLWAVARLPLLSLFFLSAAVRRILVT